MLFLIWSTFEKNNIMNKENSMNVLHENQFGYVAKCICCDDFQIKFGNIIIPFNEKEFREFDLFFEEVRQDFEYEVEDATSEYFIKTYLDGLTFSFSYRQLVHAIELLDFSKVMMSVNKLMAE